MGFDGCFSGSDTGVAKGNDFVLGRGFEVGEVGENGPGHGRGETDEAHTDGSHCGVWRVILDVWRWKKNWRAKWTEMIENKWRAKWTERIEKPD